MLPTFLGIASFTIIAISTAFWIRALKRVEIPENRGAYIVAWVAAAFFAVSALVSGTGWVGGVPAGIGLFAAAFFLATVVIGGQKVSEGAIRVGDSIPGFTAIDEHGQVFDAQSLSGHPVLIKFFRGHW